MMGLAWLCSSKRNAINLRLIVTGVLLQFAMGILILRTTPGMVVFDVARTIANQIVGFSDQGAEFVFGEGFREHFFAFSVLPIIIFMSSLMAVLYHLGIIQKVVQGMAWLMVRVMDVSGTESLSAAANVFFGQTEAPLAIKPYLNTMTRSELMAMMTGGMATIAGSVMGAYVAMGIDAGHLLSASLMSAPASLVIAKIMIPETEDSPTKGVVRISVPRTDENLLDAACRGAGEGLQLALNVAAMIIAFIALVAMLNWVIGLLPAVQGAPLSLERILGWICSPLAWLMGIQWSDATTVGQLLGERIYRLSEPGRSQGSSRAAFLCDRDIRTLRVCQFCFDRHPDWRNRGARAGPAKRLCESWFPLHGRRDACGIHDRLYCGNAVMMLSCVLIAKTDMP
jgi:CNT family concentrative nucleoside transporter